MSEDDDSRRARSRHGVCHRCGWRGMVARPRRQDRKRLRTRRAFGRMCDDCQNELIGHTLEGSGTTALRKFRNKALRSRDVA